MDIYKNTERGAISNVNCFIQRIHCTTKQYLLITTNKQTLQPDSNTQHLKYTWTAKLLPVHLSLIRQCILTVL